MLRINRQGTRIILSNMEQRYLPKVLDWYNCYENYGKATAREQSLSLQELEQKYQEFLRRTDILFTMIALKPHGQPIGMIQGFLMKKKKGALFLSIFLIDQHFQKMGYGSEAIFEFFSLLSQEKRLKSVYLACARENALGMYFWQKIGFTLVEEMRAISLPERDLQDIVIFRREI